MRTNDHIKVQLFRAVRFPTVWRQSSQVLLFKKRKIDLTYLTKENSIPQRNYMYYTCMCLHGISQVSDAGKERLSEVNKRYCQTLTEAEGPKKHGA